MRICVIGGTGQQGYEQVIAGLEKGYEVVAVGRSRSESRQTKLNSEKISWHKADLAVKSDVMRILEGVDYLLINMPSSSFNDEGKLLAMFDNLINVSEDTALKKIIFNTSMYVAEGDIEFQAPRVRRKMIGRLKQSGRPYVTVKPVIYMDNLLTAWTLPGIKEQNIFRYPHHENLEVSWICLRDVAHIMLALTKHDQFDGHEITIGGPETLKGADVARHLSTTLGRQIDFQSMPIHEFGKIMADLFADKNTFDAKKISNELVKVYTWYNTSPVEPFKVDMKPLIDKLGIQMTDFSQWVQKIDWVKDD
ncbi:hypothetical protein IMCC14465_09560 [alpha proteobacterium IMCC14465]|uniref:NmrA-like domain-containing protein n=1 Tax=alpha proteobacterium IMCC14465 TaxID=1220535 RepID=J9A493_9PROT|nr:hypothetical protein IMCC14465_09560 [alpha proteobacterium IMCC14465]